MNLFFNSFVGCLFFARLSAAHAEFPANESTKLSGDALKQALPGNRTHCTSKSRGGREILMPMVR